MHWEDKVAVWLCDEVTVAFFKDLQKDLELLQNELITANNVNKALRLQGMCRAYKGILDAPQIDGIPNPKSIKELENAHRRCNAD